MAQVEKDILKTREQYAAALLLTPPAPDQADLLYQELLLQQRNYDSLLSQYQQAQYQNFYEIEYDHCCRKASHSHNTLQTPACP